MAKRAKRYYVARWARAGHPSTANVSFYALSDHHAKMKADKLARDMGVTNTPRSIMEGGRVVEMLNTGVSLC